MQARMGFMWPLGTSYPADLSRANLPSRRSGGLGNFSDFSLNKEIQ